MEIVEKCFKIMKKWILFPDAISPSFHMEHNSSRLHKRMNKKNDEICTEKFMQAKAFCAIFKHHFKDSRGVNVKKDNT
jgi:hypothetical protein